MMDALERFYVRQRRSITRQFARDMSRCHMALPLDILRKLPHSFGWEIVPLEGRAAAPRSCC
jgi:hypothetical protein